MCEKGSGGAARRGPPSTQQGEPSRLEKHTALEVLKFLNQYSETEYRGAKAHINLIAERLREGYSINDLCVVAWYCHTLWEYEPEFRVNLRPETLWGSEDKIEKYLDPARSRWNEERTDRPIDWAKEGRA